MLPIARTTATFALCAQVLFSSAAIAQADKPKFIGNFRDWNVFTFKDGDDTLCYIASEPKKQDGNYARRGAPNMLVTRIPGNPPIDEVSVQPGYSYLADSEVEVKIEGESFDLFTKGEHAWAKTESEDKAIIEAMKAGSGMTVRGTSTKKTYSLDTYSLLGFTRAYQAMVDACRS